MRMPIVNTGYVGLVAAACYSEFGVEVTCVDNDTARVARLSPCEIPVFSPDLEKLVRDNLAVGRLAFRLASNRRSP